jgi:hypothetical protein
MAGRKRAAIVGTAESWKECPFDDRDLYIASLNDAYMLQLPRVDEWHELHPIDKFTFRKRDQKVIDGRSVPPGHYVRPEGHLEWLRDQAQRIPVWLQATPPDDWPALAQRLPLEALQDHFGVYWASGPAYMLMHLYLRGFRDIAIYGIHLATDHEYREQRPNFEFLIGRLIGASVKETRQGTMRVWEGQDVTIRVPVASPILAHGWRYAYEAKPQPPATPYRDELAKVRKAKGELVRRLVQWPVGQDKTTELERLEWLEVLEADCAQQIGKLNMAATLRCDLAAT